MKRLHTILSLAFITTLNVPAWAAEQTVVLSVPGMNCAACPITVNAALKKVDGVLKADVSYEKREVTVTFDDTKTSPQVLSKATADAGYPSSVKK